MRTLFARLGHVGKAFLLLLDAAACFVWLAPLYIVGLSNRPTGQQLISAYTGRAALNGMGWALRLERVIDALLGAGHCRACAKRYAGFAD